MPRSLTPRPRVVNIINADTRRPSLSITPVRWSEVRDGQAGRYVCITLPTALGNNGIFSISGYFETTRSFSHLVFEAGWPGTSLS